VCPPAQVVTNNYDSVTVKVDTFYQVNPQDSAMIEALIYCDSLNNAYLDSFLIINGKRTTITKPRLVNHRLKVKSICKEDSLINLLSVVRKVSSKVTVEMKEVPVYPHNWLYAYAIFISILCVCLILLIKWR
jgi:hypothetical protein